MKNGNFSIKTSNLFTHLFNLFNNLFKVDKFTKIQYTYIVTYPILQKNLVIFLIKTKEKGNKK